MTQHIRRRCRTSLRDSGSADCSSSSIFAFTPSTHPRGFTTVELLVVIVVIAILAAIKAISAGGDNTCAIASDNKAYCWGYNEQGQLGNDSSTDSLVPIAVSPIGS